MTTTVDRVGLPPSGWYPDPVRGRHTPAHARRFWDGQQWTAQVADGDLVACDPLPPPEPDLRTALPGRAGWVALAGFLLGQLLAVGGLALGAALAPDGLALRLLLSQAGLWTGLLGACVLASRRWGTGRLRTDYGLVSRVGDAGRGLLLSLGARLLAGVVLVLVALAARGLAGSNAGIFSLAEHDPAALVLLAVFAVLGAPLVEETFFRGLLQGALRCRLGAVAAVGLQACAFGCAHVTPQLGWGNVGLVLSLTAAGAVLGTAAERYRRLGPSIWAHGLFNLLPAVVLLSLALR